MSCTSFEVLIEDNIKGLAVMCIMNILKNPERKDLYFDNIDLVVKSTNDTLNLFKKMKERDMNFIGDLQQENLELEKKIKEAQGQK